MLNYTQKLLSAVGGRATASEVNELLFRVGVLCSV